MSSKMSLTHLQLELPNGERIDVSLSFLNSTNAINGSLTSGSGSAEADDGYGAMLYVVVTVCVYSLGIVAFVGGHIYKRSENKRQDVLVTDYMSSVHVGKLERIRRMETVQRTSLQITRDTSKSSIVRTQSYDQIPGNNNAVTEGECLNDNQGDVQPTLLQITRDTSIDRTQSSDGIFGNNNAVIECLNDNHGDVQRTSLQITRDTSIDRTQSCDQIPDNNNAVTEALSCNQGDVQPTSLQITRDTSIDRTQSSDAIPSNNNAVTEHLTGNQGDSEVTEVDSQYLTV